MTTTFDKNLFVQNGQLYISPTLTSDEIGNDAIFNGGSYKLDVRPYCPLMPDAPRYITSHGITISRVAQTRLHPRVPLSRILVKKLSYPRYRVRGSARRVRIASATVR